MQRNDELLLIDKEKIKEAKTKIGDKTAYIILENLGITEYDEKNLKSLCVYHDEKTPSFVYRPKQQRFHCYGCGKSVDIIDSFMHKGLTYLESVQKVFELAKIVYPFGELGVKTKNQYIYPKPIYNENNDRIYEYLEKRHISKETADYLNLKQDKHGNILIQYFDLNDVLTMVKVRKGQPVPHGELKCWYLTDGIKRADGKETPYGTTPILYNMNRVNYDNPLLITSGELDCAAAIEAGYHNTVSIPMGDGNTQWVQECWDFLERFDNIIICPDNDESGAKYCKEIVPRLGSWKCKIANIPEYFDDWDETRHKVKDLNECLFYFGKEKVLEIIYNAKDTPVPSVDNLSDVKDLDLTDLEGVCTGLDILDRELMKIFYGTLTILSGMPGAGKSSLLSQLTCAALDQGVNTWIFSGELQEFMAKNWFTFVFAGRRNVMEYKLPNGDLYYKVTPEAKKAIDDYYDARWFIYKDDCENDLDLLIQSMTDVVRKYNVKFLILDNMMTIGVDDTADELKEQTKTIKKLISFSKKYNVATILVCHPRKLSQTATVGMYDISGTSNIANLAHRTIGMRKVTEDEKDGTDKNSTLKKSLREFDVVINIIKDRMRGRSNISRGLYYDVASRRFYTNPKEFDHKYKWDTKEYAEKLPYPVIDRTNEVFGEIKNKDG